MKIIEVEAKTIDDAIEKACREFDVPREKLNIEIISEGSSGILGIGAKKAKIRAGILSLDALGKELGNALQNVDKESERKKRRLPDEAHPKLSKESPVAETIPSGPSVVADRAEELLAGILKRMSFEVPFTREETAESIVFKIAGDGTGALIGKGGQTLDAIQYVINKAVSTLSSDNDKRKIILDTEEYREKREDYLVSLAKRLADKVKRTRKPVTVDHMNAHDRRIIHMALQGDASLVTKSRGEGAYRKIVIMPAKKQSNAESKSDNS